MLTFKNRFQNSKLLKQWSISDAEETKFVTVSQIGMIGVPQVREGVVGHAMRLIDNHTHFCAFTNNCTRSSQTALGFALCNYLTVTGTVFLKLHSKCV